MKNHPLDSWTSPAVTNVLIDFYEQNFTMAGMKPGIASSVVNKVWENKSLKKNKVRLEALREFEAGKGKIKRSKEDDPRMLIDLSECNVFADIGANKLSSINLYAQKHKHIKKLYAIDIIPQRSKFWDPNRCHYIQVSPTDNNYPIAKNSVDVINIQFVLHHFENSDYIKQLLKNCHKLLSPSGKIILWEETFEETFDSRLYEHNNQKYGIFTDRGLTENFYQLSLDERWQFIKINDWFINLSNPHMPWTGQYHAWDEWVDLFAEYNFLLDKKYNFGLRRNGLLKQGVHMIGIFKKTG